MQTQQSVILCFFWGLPVCSAAVCKLPRPSASSAAAPSQPPQKHSQSQHGEPSAIRRLQGLRRAFLQAAKGSSVQQCSRLIRFLFAAEWGAPSRRPGQTEGSFRAAQRPAALSAAQAGLLGSPPGALPRRGRARGGPKEWPSCDKRLTRGPTPGTASRFFTVSGYSLCLDPHMFSPVCHRRFPCRLRGCGAALDAQALPRFF